MWAKRRAKVLDWNYSDGVWGRRRLTLSHCCLNRWAPKRRCSGRWRAFISRNPWSRFVAEVLPLFALCYEWTYSTTWLHDFACKTACSYGLIPSRSFRLLPWRWEWKEQGANSYLFSQVMVNNWYRYLHKSGNSGVKFAFELTVRHQKVLSARKTFALPISTLQKPLLFAV